MALPLAPDLIKNEKRASNFRWHEMKVIARDYAL